MLTDTLANLRSALSKRLGFGTQGDTAGPFQDLLSAFLVDAHEQLFIEYEWPELRRDWILPLVANQTLYALPADTDGRTADPERILGVFVQVNAAWSPLDRGIDPVLYTIITSGIPSRYDIAHGAGNVPAQGFTADQPILEIWQAPAAAYNLRIRAYAQSTAFAADADTTLVDSRLVFLMALANAKAHYGQPDANGIAGQLQLRLRKLRARAHNGAHYRRHAPATPPPQPKIANPDEFN